MSSLQTSSEHCLSILDVGSISIAPNTVKYEQRVGKCEKNVDQVKFDILFPEGSLATYPLTSWTHSGLIFM